MKLDGVEIHIATYKLADDTVPETTLEEYGEQEDEDVEKGNCVNRKKKCFIQSDDGKNFRLKINLDKSYNAKIWIDGQLISDLALNTAAKEVSQNVDRFRPSMGKEIYFKFEPNCTTDDQALATKDGHLISNLGTIKVELRKTIYTRVKDALPPYFKYNQNVFDEKTKKGLIDHAVGGVIKPVDIKVVSMWRSGVLADPITFIFMYRSSKWLQAEEYIEYETVNNENAAPTNQVDPIEAVIRATHPDMSLENIKIKVEKYKEFLRMDNSVLQNNAISSTERRNVENGTSNPIHSTSNVSVEQIESKNELLRESKRRRIDESNGEPETIDLTDD